MNSLFRICRAAYWLALTLWVAALVTAGIAAMNTFTRLPRMQVELKQYSALPVEQHGRLAAGMVMEGVFSTVDWIQIVAAPLVLTMLMIMTGIDRPARRSIANFVRSACIVVAASLFATHIVAIAPRMNRELHAYWSNLEQGSLAEAESHLKRFDSLHPTADRLLRTNLVLLLIAVAASAMVMPLATAEKHIVRPSA